MHTVCATARNNAQLNIHMELLKLRNTFKRQKGKKGGGSRGRKGRRYGKDCRKERMKNE